MRNLLRSSRNSWSLRHACKLVGVGAVLSVLLVTNVATASGAFQATVNNPVNNTGSATYFSCGNAARGAPGIPAYFAYPLDESSGPTAADVSGSGHSGTYSATGITYNQPGPCPRDGAKAITLDGSTGAVYGSQAISNQPAISVEIWFKTSTARRRRPQNTGPLIISGESVPRTCPMVDNSQKGPP